MKLIHSIILMVASALLLQACIPEKPMRDEPYYQPLTPKQMIKNKKRNGSIYQVGQDRPLFEDISTKQVGDIITIKLVEQMQSKKSEETKTKKDDTAIIPNPILLGTVPRFDIPSWLPFPGASRVDNNLETNLQSSKRKFEGKGETSQSNLLTGTVSVTVVEVLPNNNLVVRGEKWISLTQGEEFVRVSGIIRPQDIDLNTNTVDSSKVANARISYGAKGDMDDSNTKGFLSRFFNSAYWVV